MLCLLITVIKYDGVAAYSLSSPAVRLDAAKSKSYSVLRMTGGGRKDPASKPPSQVESIVSNSKSLQDRDVEVPVRESAKYIQAMAAGLAVSLAMVPEAVAFSFVAGVSPLVGLWTTVSLVGLLIFIWVTSLSFSKLRLKKHFVFAWQIMIF